ncbi:Do family serine endopeptidase [Sulfurihydrogenibium subterraneum]|uniref:Do family serine endopeptidase n=1 Tax=Sulfurihydrogenibium subterraneum TaxID=171121 RepID=UPI00048BBC4A|nr:Do family serine endopeptidase [Sulfurihydrogenibium subterraneum]
MKKVVLPVVIILALAFFVKAQLGKYQEGYKQNVEGRSYSFSTLEAIDNERTKLIESVSPGVATVFTTQEITVNNPFFDMPFGDFFGVPNTPQFKQKRQGLGSAFIVDVDYNKKVVYLLTNNHVVENAKDIQVQFKNKMILKAKVVGGDKLSDVAVLEVPFKKGIEDFASKNVLKLGDSDQLKAGSTVIAIGAPLGLSDTVTIGIVSAKNRQIEDRPGEGFIQTDAAINPGNSGGPLINVRGEVVGINSAIIAGAQGLGFAVPINQAKWVMDQILKYGKVKRSKIGVIIQPLTADLSEHFGVNEGALVSSVQPGGPADRAGIKAGDIIVEVNGKKISDISDLQNQVMKNPPGSKLKIKVIRDGKELTFDVITVPLESDETASTEESGQATNIENTIGLIVKDITPELIKRYGLQKVDYGVLVYAVKEGSVAEEAGLLAGDIILSVNKKPVKSSAEFWQIINKAKSEKQDSVLLYVQRGDNRIYTTLSLR